MRGDRMKLTAPQIEKVVLGAIDNANQAREPDKQLDCSPDAPLYGSDSPLDSLGLVGLLFDIEDELRTEGFEVSLSDERAMSQTKSPFRSVASLVAYIEQVSAEGQPQS